MPEEPIGLADFKYSYYSADKKEQTALIQSVFMYPNRFTYDVMEYVHYIWDKYQELYTLNDVPYEEVMTDLRYKKAKMIGSKYTALKGFKITDSFGEEIAQGVYDYQKPLNSVAIHYLEFLKRPNKIAIGTLIRCLFMYKFNEEVEVRYL